MPHRQSLAKGETTIAPRSAKVESAERVEGVEGAEGHGVVALQRMTAMKRINKG